MTLRLASLVLATVALVGCGTTAEPRGDGSIDAPFIPDDAPARDAPGCTDADGDGHGAISCGGDDCDDHDAHSYPGNTEVCDAAGHDDDCNPATLGPDADGDSFPSTACCNTQPSGAPLCGTDCDDTRATVNPTAIETCDHADDNCNGSIDEGVCVACPAGYTGFDGACTDIDECAMGQCGVGAATCTNMPGTYACACMTGFMAPATAGTCLDVDECMTTAPCGTLATTCTNTIGSYACTCLPGYGAPPTGGACMDIDECAAMTCGPASVVTGCVNSVGSYACSCAAGYTAASMGMPCTDINECATGTPCGAGLGACTNTAGTYTCACNAGYAAPATGGTCADIDECATGTDSCDHDPLTCMNTSGGFACTCPAGFSGTGIGPAGCLWTDPSLTALVPSVGTLSPAFAGGVTVYSLALPSGATSLTLTPSVAVPGHATITVDGVAVASGAASASLSPTAFGPRSVLVTVTTDSGAMRVYTLVVVLTDTYVKASNTASDVFGASVALSSDGSTLAVGAYFEDSNATGVGGNQADNSAANSGAVYVYTRAGTTWSQQAYVKASNTGAQDEFGYVVALSSDGATLAVSAFAESSNATGVGGNQADNSAAYSGAVYVFTRAGTTWSQQAYIKASNTATFDFFGVALALSSDGSTLAVGANNEDSNATGVGGNQADNSAGNSGAVYVYTRSGATWSQQAYVKASNTNAGDGFGGALALSADGSTLAVGAPSEASNATGIGGNQADNSTAAAGAVYVFTLSGTTWAQQAYVKASNTNGNDNFGSALGLSANGSELAVGAPYESSNATGIDGDQTNNTAFNSGAVYVLTRSSATWSQQAYVKASNTGNNDHFGNALGLSSDGATLAVAAWGEGSIATGIGGNQADNTHPNSGAAYAFTSAGTTWAQQAYIKASNSDQNDQFAWTLTLSADGSTLAVGAIGEASNATGIGGNQLDNSDVNAGAVYVY